MRGLILLGVLPLAACSMVSSSGTAGTGSGSARDFALSGFTAVTLTGSDDVDVKIGPSFAVHATGPSDVLDQLLIERDGDTLKIGRKPVIGFNWGGKGAKISVTMPLITAAELTGSGGMTIDQVKTADFKAASTGSGDLGIAALDVQKGDLSVTGSGSINAKGKAGALAMSVMGSGDIDAKGVTASSADVSIMGSGSANATVNGAAKVDIMGSGDADLGAGATCTTSKMGSGDVTCGHR